MALQPNPFISARNAAKQAAELMLRQHQESTDVHMAQRGQRLSELFQSPVWSLDLLPLFYDLYDRYLEKVKTKEVDPDVLKPLDDFITLLNGKIQLGIGAAKRITERRLLSAEKLTEAATP